LIEGNSFTQFAKPDQFVMVIRPAQIKTKATARRALKYASALYVSSDVPMDLDHVLNELKVNLPVFSAASLQNLVEHLQAKDFPSRFDFGERSVRFLHLRFAFKKGPHASSFRFMSECLKRG